MPKSDQYVHCCDDMVSHLETGEMAIHFNEKFREYGIWYTDKVSFQLLHYCPWCGSELPSSLRDEWFDQLEVWGMEPDDPRIPASYRTAEWWMSGPPQTDQVAPSLRRLVDAAEAGDGEAQVQLGAMLATGDGLEKDTEKAAYWYRKAVAKKHPEALYNLGLMYLLGETKRGTRDRGKALIEDAADRGSWDASWFLGQVYLEGGYGLKKDTARGAYHLVHALGCKFGNAALALGLALKERRRIDAASLSDAFIEVAARSGNKKALGLIPPGMARKIRRRLMGGNQ